MKELVYSVKVVTRDALLGRVLDAADCIRNSQLKLQLATRSVHNRAAACVAAGGGIFKKPALSTDQFKLKVILRSKLHIYTSNVSCIMLVYYFVPFIVNNRYLPF